MSKNNFRFVFSSFGILLLSVVTLFVLLTNNNLSKFIDFYLPSKILAVINFIFIVVWFRFNYDQMKMILKDFNNKIKLSNITLFIFIGGIVASIILEILFGNDRLLGFTVIDRVNYQTIVDFIFLLSMIS